MISQIKLFLEYRPSKLKPLIHKINDIHSLVPGDFGGGCSLEKALLMALLIKEFKLNKTADIGVYRGRSLFPQAIAHKFYSRGKVLGVDPYSSEAAVQNDRPEIQAQLEAFVAKTDFEQLYEKTQEIINNQKLENYCEIVREKSADAAVEFKSNAIKFGLVHIDGNHDTKFVVEDVKNYLPLLLDKSFIVLDDISWDSVKPAMTIVDAEMDYIGKLIDKKNDFALFAKGFSKKEKERIRFIFKKCH